MVCFEFILQILFAILILKVKELCPLIFEGPLVVKIFFSGADILSGFRLC